MKKILLMLVSVWGWSNLPAVEIPRQVSGRITSNTGETLPYANIWIKNTTTGCSSDENGNFTLQLPREGNYTLVVRYTGFEPLEKQIYLKGDTALHFTLNEDHLNLNQVTVTATRTPKLLKDAPIITKVITAQDIRKLNPVTLIDVLERELPGIEFVREMDKKTQSINMHGMGGNYILFLIDGERMAGETLDNIDYNRLDISSIERIEIVKGTACALYGSNALGGVVNIITRNTKKPFEAYAGARYGSHNEQQYNGSVGFKNSRVSSLTSAVYKSRDNYYLNGVNENGVQIANPVYGGKDYNLNEKLIWSPADVLSFTAKGGMYSRDVEINDVLNNRYRDFNGGIQMNYLLSGKQNLTVSYLYDQYNKYDIYTRAHIDSLTYKDRQQTVRTQYNYLFGDGNVFIAGVEWFHDRLLSYQFSDGSIYSTHNYTVYAQHDFNLAENWNVIYGGRLDYHTTFGTHFNPSISLMYKLHPFTFRGSYSHGVRLPSLKELHTEWDMGNQHFLWIKGNPDLTPEKNNYGSLSAEYSKGRVNITAIGYYNRINHKISSITHRRSSASAMDTSVYVNIAKADIAGLDINIAVKCPYGFDVRAAYSYVHDRQMQDAKNLSATRPHTATFGLDYDYSKLKNYFLNISLSGRIVGKVTTTEESSTGPGGYIRASYPAYTMWNLSVNQRIHKAWSIRAGIDNLLNYKAKDVTALNAPITSGTTFYAGLSVNIDELFNK